MERILVNGRCTKCNNVQNNMEYTGVFSCKISSSSYGKDQLSPKPFNFYCVSCKEERIFIPE